MPFSVDLPLAFAFLSTSLTSPARVSSSSTSFCATKRGRQKRNTFRGDFSKFVGLRLHTKKLNFGHRIDLESLS